MKTRHATNGGSGGMVRYQRIWIYIVTNFGISIFNRDGFI